jgi:hypothetical protein
MTGRSMPEYGSTIRVAMPLPRLAGRAAAAGEGEGDADGEGEGDGDGVKLGNTLGASRTLRKSRGSRSGASDEVVAGVAPIVGVASARAITGAVYESRPETTSMTPPRAISVERKRANERCDGGMAAQHQPRGTPPRRVARRIGLQTRAGSFSRSTTPMTPMTPGCPPDQGISTDQCRQCVDVGALPYRITQSTRSTSGTSPRRRLPCAKHRDTATFRHSTRDPPRASLGSWIDASGPRSIEARATGERSTGGAQATAPTVTKTRATERRMR